MNDFMIILFGLMLGALLTLAIQGVIAINVSIVSIILLFLVIFYVVFKKKKP